MAAKLTLHCQGVPGFVGRFLERAGSTHLKGIGNYPTYPGVTTIGRVYYDQSKVDDQVRGGAVGADAIFGACWPEIQKNPQVHIWETPANEASIWDPAVAGSYVAFNQRLIQRFHEAGKKIIVGAINVGWPRLPNEDGGAMMRLIRDAARGADGLSFHEYGWEDMRQGATYHCLRYRRFHDYVGGDHPPIYITECGLDRTSPPGPDFGHSGWRVVLNGNEQAYVDQLIWYEQEMRKDPYVVCATIFTAGPSGWGSFDMYEGVSMRLADALAALGPGPEPPPPEPPPDPPVEGPVTVKIYDWDGVERDQAWLQANYGQVTVSKHGDYGQVCLHEHLGGSSTLVTTVKDQGGVGDHGVVVTFSWPDGVVHGITNHEGSVGFGMGGGAYFTPPGPGPHKVQAGNVTVAGLGMVMGTNHDHLDVVFQETDPTPEPPEPPDPPPLGDMAWGIDVSDWQGTIDWEKVAASGCSFAMIRASVCRSDGTLVPDGRFLANWNGAGSVGLRRGVYHYLGVEQRGQAAFFVAVVGEREPELGYWADLEHNGLDSARCSEFLTAVDRNLAGRGVCHVYTRASFVDRWGSPPWAAGRLLWVAHWTAGDSPLMPKAWDTWEFWQHTSYGSVPGIQGRVDMDRYNGTVEQFHEEYGGEPYEPPEPPTYYTLTALIEGDGTLEVFPPFGSEGRYEAGTYVQLTAFPDEGWVFDHWSGDVGTDAGETVGVTMDGDRTVTAHFVEETEPPPGTTYGLGVDVEGGGVVQVVPEKPEGYEPGDTVSLTAYPDQGWVFDHWSGDVMGISPAVVITMDRDKNVTAHFVQEAPDEWDLLFEKLDRIVELLEVIAG